jgi:hypothetical protein
MRRSGCGEPGIRIRIVQHLPDIGFDFRRTRFGVNTWCVARVHAHPRAREHDDARKQACAHAGAHPLRARRTTSSGAPSRAARRPATVREYRRRSGRLSRAAMRGSSQWLFSRPMSSSRASARYKVPYAANDRRSVAAASCLAISYPWNSVTPSRCSPAAQRQISTSSGTSDPALRRTCAIVYSYLRFPPARIRTLDFARQTSDGR